MSRCPGRGILAASVCSLVGVVFLLGTGCSPGVQRRASDLISIRAYDQAIALLEQETTRAPRDAALHRLLGDALFGSAMERGARAARGSDAVDPEIAELRRRADASYAAALALSPKDPTLLYHAAVAMADESPAQSMSLLEELLGSSPGHPAARFYAWTCRRTGRFFRADSLDSVSASHARPRGAWNPVLDSAPAQAGSFIVVADSGRVRTVAGMPAGAVPQWAVYAFTRDSLQGVRFQRPRQQSREGWMLQGEVDAIQKEPRLNTFMGGRRQERFIVYAAPTELPPDEVANSNWGRMPTVEVDRSGHEFETDEELQTVHGTGELRQVGYTPQGTFLMFNPSFVWEHVIWVETLEDWCNVDTSAVVCLPVTREVMQQRVNGLRRLNVHDPEMRRNLLRGRIAAGFTLPMTEAALGPMEILPPGWHGDAMVQERRMRTAQGALRLRFEDGVLTSWVPE